jgi:hypothetical protein
MQKSRQERGSARAAGRDIPRGNSGWGKEADGKERPIGTSIRDKVMAYCKQMCILPKRRVLVKYSSYSE